MKAGAAPNSASTKRPRVSSSDSSGNEYEDNRADLRRSWKKPGMKPDAYEDNQLGNEEFSRFRDEFLQMKTNFKKMEEESQQMKLKLEEMEEESQQMRAEMALIKSHTMETDTQATSETSTGTPTLSQRMRTRLDVYSTVEVERLIHDITLEIIYSEELCRQPEVDAQFSDIEDRYDSYSKSEIDRKLEEVEEDVGQKLTTKLQESLCNVDEVEEIVDDKLKKVYTKNQVDHRLYDLEKEYAGRTSLETEELILDVRSELERDLRDEIKYAKTDLEDWMETEVRSRMKSATKALKMRMHKKTLGRMPPRRKPLRGPITVKYPRGPITVKDTGSD